MSWPYGAPEDKIARYFMFGTRYIINSNCRQVVCDGRLVGQSMLQTTRKGFPSFYAITITNPRIIICPYNLDRARHLSRWVSSKTPTCAPSTLNASPSCPKTCTWPDDCGVSADRARKPGRGAGGASNQRGKSSRVRSSSMIYSAHRPRTVNEPFYGRGIG